MKGRMRDQIVSGRMAHAFPWSALPASLLFAIVTVPMPVAPLRAANQNASPSLMGQPQAQTDRKSAGCISCHTQTDEPTMHATGTVILGCADCHGGNAEVRVAAGIVASSPEY